MSFNKYYQEELIALRELGLEFAEANPGLAHFLSTPGRDPDVERILEGFAFLSGRLRQKLDDELPEITHGLFSLLWPNYLRTIPSCSVIQYQPTGNLSGGMTVPRQTEVQSLEVEGTKCSFRTAFATDVYPFELTRQYFAEKFGTTVMGLDFTVLNGDVTSLELRDLRFFLNGEKNISHTIYYTLLKKVKEIRVIVKDGRKKDVITASLPAGNIQPVGFKEEEGLFPYPANSFPGYRILQEYFCFPEKFQFVDVQNVGAGLTAQALGEIAGAGEFSLHFVLDELPNAYESFRKENWRLFCTPIVNLFSMDASPLNLTPRQTESRIVPDPRRPYHFNIYSVDGVGAWTGGRSGAGGFSSFESFVHDFDGKNSKSYYRLRLKPSIKDDGTETYLSIVHPPGKRTAAESLVVSIELTCSNRRLAASLGMGDIRDSYTDAPGNVSFKNITPVTPPYNPPLEGDILWRLLSNMSLNYISLTNVDSLRAVLAAYDFRALHDKQRARLLFRQMQGIRHARSEETDRIYNGLPIRGSRTTLTLDERYFACEGDMYLFGGVLNEFLALYATVNSFHQFNIIEERRKEHYAWPARLGGATPWLRPGDSRLTPGQVQEGARL